MKITERLASMPSDQPFWTFEFFPPKAEAAMGNLLSRISRMSSLNPAWVHVTWGAGGSTQERSLDLAGAAKEMYGMPICLHLTCTNMEKDKLDDTLKKAKELGIQNILALRGDPPRGQEYWVAASDEFQYATDLVKYIKRHHGDDFCVGVAGYPEGNPDSADKLVDIDYLKEKMDAGADFVVTQLFYDVDRFLTWLKACRGKGITIPIIPGVMPIQNYQTFRRVTNLCKSTVPPNILKDLEPLKHNDQAVKDYGVKLAIQIIQRLKSEGVRGVHLCTLNLEKSVRRILEGLCWVDPEGTPTVPNRLVATTSSASRRVPVHTLRGLLILSFPSPELSQTGHLQPDKMSSNRSSVSLRSLDSSEGDYTTPIHPGLLAAPGDSHPTWDEFPNGRFGDARSPAYGDIDGYGVSLKIPPSEALKHWGYPVEDSDISRIFAAYIQGRIPAIPWSEEALLSETDAIRPDLLHLNLEKSWWTVGSQPAVNGVPSADPVFGFGPAGGYVYQKAFVEFFVDEQVLNELTEKAKKDKMVTWYASNRKGEFRTNMESGGANAVTWGVFKGQEIVTTTLIEEVSFKAWKEEAFEVWTEWEVLYATTTASSKLIRAIGDSRWLVSIVHHDYVDDGGLWKFLGTRK